MTSVLVKENVEIWYASVEWTMRSCGIEMCTPSVQH